MSDTLRELALIAADTLPLWRDAAVMALAGIVIVALYLYATLMGIE